MNEIRVISKSIFLDKEIDVYGTVETPLFLAKDVADWIEHSDVSMMVKNVDDEEKVTSNVCTLGGNQDAWFLTEDGLYEVLMQSRKPIAKQFKKGVKEILKSIRKTGAYSTTVQIKDRVEAGMIWIEGCKKILNLSESSTLLLMQRIAEPLGLPTPDYVTSKGVLHTATDLLKKFDIKMSAVKFNKKLLQIGFLQDELRRGREKPHKYKVITERGLPYGENKVSTQSQLETQPYWYDDKFLELLKLIGE